MNILLNLLPSPILRLIQPRTQSRYLIRTLRLILLRRQTRHLIQTLRLPR